MQNSSPKFTLKQRILALYESGMTSAAQIHRRISRVMQVTLITIERKANKRMKGLLFEQAQRNQRNDKFLTDEIANEIQEYPEEHSTASASQIVHDLNCDISIRTMRRMLKQLGYCFSSTFKFPLLTPEHIIFWENLRSR